MVFIFTIVFSDKDKDKLLANGYNFIKSQNMNGKDVYIFSGDGNFNFEENNIKYIKTNDLCV